MSIVIHVENLSKEYRLGVINHGMLYKDIQSWIARKLKKPDPHSMIGEQQFLDRGDVFWALKNMNFEIEQGDRIGIIGKNGAGKSTLLKVLSRITAPSKGVVKIKGRVTSLLEVGTGFHSELTGRENIFLNGAILGMKKKEINSKIDEIINFAEIEKFIDTPAKRYSSGMYVRLAFAVAAHLDSDILIADEVLAVGDSSFQKKALGKMNELSKGQGKTVLFVSHNLVAVRQLCNKGMLLEKGENGPIKSIDEVIQFYDRAGENNRITDISNYRRKNNCSLRAKIVDFSIITDEGINTGRIQSDKRVNVKFVVESYFDNVKTAMQIFVSHNGQNILMFDSGHLKNKLFSLDKGKYELECSIEKMLLYSGQYSMSIGLDIPATEQLDSVPDAYYFEVSHYDPAYTGYNLHIDNGWGIYNPDHEYKCFRIADTENKIFQ